MAESISYGGVTPFFGTKIFWRTYCGVQCKYHTAIGSDYQ
jgi:hypothetical protein